MSCALEVWSNATLPDLRLDHDRDFGLLERLGLWRARRDVERWYRETGRYPAGRVPRHLFVIHRPAGAPARRWEHWGGHRVPGAPGPGRRGLVLDRARPGNGDATTDADALLAPDPWVSRRHLRREWTCPADHSAATCAALAEDRVLAWRFADHYPHGPDFRSPWGYLRERAGLRRNALGVAINSNTFVAALLAECGVEVELDAGPYPGFELAGDFPYARGAASAEELAREYAERNAGFESVLLG